MKEIVKKIEQKDGRTIEIRTGKLAKQAHGSVELRMGDSVLLATVVSNKDAKDDVDFLPLTVDYREKFAADGRFPGGFLKREARPTDHEILIMRLVDRILRPLFPSDYHADTQIMLSLVSHDENVCPEALAGLGASAALAVSDIPFNGPISEVRVGRVNGELIANPSPAQLEESDIDMVIGASADSVAMVEGEMDEISEAEMVEAIKFAHDEIKNHCAVQLELTKEVGTETKREYSHENHDKELEDNVMAFCYDKFYSVAKKASEKHARSNDFKAIKDAFKETLSAEELAEKSFMLGAYFKKAEKKAVRDMVLNENVRLDGRNPSDIRPIWCEVDYLPRPHGSALFTRGETQSITTVTLGTKMDENRIDGVTKVGSERFYLHYNFPPFSTGEARPIRGVSRREIGHGNLAQRALSRMIDEDNPYTVRVVSDILESNGSSSMATVCAGTMALMDAGVKLRKPVSGIAMGLITDGNKFAVLSDILGDEDFLGDMDFKVCGTKDGITACQMDIKIEGLSYEILTQALEQSNAGRMHILGKLTDTISETREQLKPHVPKIHVMYIPKDTIGAVIGPGGKIIQQLQADTDTTITIEEIDNQGKVEILGTGQELLDNAISEIKALTFTPEVGDVFTGTVRSIMPYGAFVNIGKGTDGLLHISEINWERVENVEDVLKEGDKVEVKLTEIDAKSGKLRLSRKVLLPKPEKK
ncbi:MAG: polyribonucleotide nucleotidyltransferase [Flavobacteriales bacterium]|jgi:polyribonucleotide nucleotidyltransferase|nr:polyribonucleotide nucleotidyltransferase [Flavobacteriales bacterium]|tara:strand:+ start:46 stop:2157 length:2112 start_codon:yes stop_codon:yes gene_type:complete